MEKGGAGAGVHRAEDACGRAGNVLVAWQGVKVGIGGGEK